MVVFTGQVRTKVIGNDAFQEADTRHHDAAVTKWFLIKTSASCRAAINEAFLIARTGRPGPVLIDLPKDITRRGDRRQPAATSQPPGNQPTTEGNAEADPARRQR